MSVTPPSSSGTGATAPATHSSASAMGPATERERLLVERQEGEPTLGRLVADTTQHFSSIVRNEIALAKKEISVDAKKGGIGAGMLAAAAFFALMGLIFLLHTIAQGLIALGLAAWLSYLIVTLLLFAAAGVLALLGKKKLSQIKGKPERTIATTQETVEAVKQSVKH